MRRHAASIAFFLCGFAVAATAIQVSYAQRRPAPVTNQSGGSLAVDSNYVFVLQGNRLFQVPANSFEQKHVQSVILK